MPARMRHVRAIAVVMGCASVALAVSVPAQAAPPRHGNGIERAVLPAGDGWAAAEGSTTGGSQATPEHVYTVTNRAELIAAFKDAGDAPKIVRIAGTVHGNSDVNGTPIGCEAYQQGGYTLENYLAAYDPEVWGRDEVPSGPWRTPARPPRSCRPPRSTSTCRPTPRSSASARTPPSSAPASR